MVKSKDTKKSPTRETMGAVKNMVEFMKDEVDKAIANLSHQGQIEFDNTTSVSSLIKMSIDNAFVKSAESIEKSLK